jgi:hypothetical protein
MRGFGFYIKNGLRLIEKLSQKRGNPKIMQDLELKKLLKKARFTSFGTQYSFHEIIKAKNGEELYQRYKALVPLFSYNQIKNSFWQKARDGEENVCWPGKIKYFATSSGTSEASYKYIPVSDDMIKAIQKTGIRQLLTLPNYQFPLNTYESEVMILGGCTSLIDKGPYFEGDLSGIQAAKLPKWFRGIFRPGFEISSIRDWNEKLDAIAKNAHKWNIGAIMGVPAWNQIMIEKIIKHQKVKTIHELWPNLRIYVHGGVPIDPYLKSFEKMFSKPMTFMETYLASEGFLAYQSAPGKKEMSLVLDNGIFYEFIPFTPDNFDENWELKPNAEALNLSETEEEKEYALVISTCAGAWRYLIGDVVKITSKIKAEIIITGRTKQFLSLCGEHLSIENLNDAISHVSTELKIDIREFTVSGVPFENLFAHKWYIGTDDIACATEIKQLLDQKLKILNTDYRIKRSVTLKDVMVEILPVSVFYQWHKETGKEGGQHKFPRVLKGKNLVQWQQFLAEVRMR